MNTRNSVLCLAAALAGVLILAGGCGPAPATDGSPVEEAVGTPAESEAVAEPIELVSEDGLPGESYGVLAPDAAWSWLGGPRAVSIEGEHRRTYVGFTTSSGDVTLTQFDHDSGEIVATVVKEQLQPDDHASPALLVRPDNRLMVFYCGHRGRWMIYRTSSGAEDISSWGAERGASGHTSAFAGYTYPNAAVLAGEGGRRYVFWRGDGHRPMFASAEPARPWGAAAVLMEGEGAKPYVRTASDGQSTIHLAFSDGHPGEEPANSIRYLRYSDGEFRRADGTLVGTVENLPLKLEDADLVYDAAASGVRSWLWDIAFDASGSPVIAYAAFPGEDDHRYRYARWSGAAWVDSEITAAGSWFPEVERQVRRFDPYQSGGIALDHTDPGTVYLSRPVGGVFEIERWTTPDGGESWVSEAVTSGSARDNVRPVVPLGHAPGGPELIWMNGTYVDYMSYSTSLRMK